MVKRTTKTKEERLSDGLKVLRKLQEIGVPRDNSGFTEVQAAISKWVADGVAASVKKINFFPFDREGELTLSTIAGVEPIMRLRLITADDD
jgi:hypothetical protein